MTEAPRYCDIVMKGGIASGIVYPNAILALARRYRFKNIGGTSAGAIAAAALAAAALGERRRQSPPGAAGAAPSGLDGLQRVADSLRTAGFIPSLFRPARGAAAAFDLLRKLTAKPGLRASLVAIARAALRIAPWPALVTAAVLLGLAGAIGGGRGALAAAVPALVCVLLVAVGGAAMRVAGLLRANQLGLCSGLGSPGDGGSGPALTDWMHDMIQDLSGNGDVPLTFQQLWDAPRYPDEPQTRNALQLAMITTGISHHEPRTLPFEKSRFWFREDEFRRLFPAPVVDSMLGPDPLEIDGRAYHVLPEDGALPVLVATRMSLSLPLLLSAVPLYEADYRAMRRAAPDAAAARTRGDKLLSSTDALAQGGERTGERPTVLRVCWFSDGGIASNFPIHLFDAALPRWPTFAINLTYPDSTDQPEPIFLPTENSQGWQRVYSSFAARNPLQELAGFLFAIVATMQNWRDLLQSRAPGHRDRIVHVALGPEEGGMNLDMPAPVLDAIARKGTLAGEALAQRFDFNNHWWVRWRNAASGLERFLGEFATGAATPITPDYADARSSAATGAPPPPSYRFRAAQQDEAVRRFNQLKDEGELWADHAADLTEGAPKPLPQLRITPTY
jgi:predicted acylesterase/phospholipase RssA